MELCAQDDLSLWSDVELPIIAQERVSDALFALLKKYSASKVTKLSNCHKPYFPFRT
jgi:hypothetical protein